MKQVKFFNKTKLRIKPKLQTLLSLKSKHARSVERVRPLTNHGYVFSKNKFFMSEYQDPSILQRKRRSVDTSLNKNIFQTVHPIRNNILSDCKNEKYKSNWMDQLDQFQFITHDSTHQQGMHKYIC